MPELSAFIKNRDPRYIIFSNEEKRRIFTTEIAIFVGGVALVQPDVLLYLDKSARPISWVVNSVMKARFPDKKRPETKYLHFGRENQDIALNIAYDDGSRREKPISNRALQIAIEDINEIYRKRGGGTYLDNKRVWVIDEISSSGLSLGAAKILLDEAFGDRMAEPVLAKSVLSWEPAWYHNNWMIGVQSNDSGNRFLSVGTKAPKNTKQLRGELKSIASDISEQY